MDRLNAMRVFVAVADAGGLSAAGRRLGMPLTTVSRQLKALEEALDTRLVTRTTRRLALTEPGRAYLETCRRVLSDLDAAERRLAGEQAEPQGVLALTAHVVFGICPYQPGLRHLLKLPRRSFAINFVMTGASFRISFGTKLSRTWASPALFLRYCKE